jgi:hypothetical protein
MQIERDLSAYQMIPLRFMQSQVSAGQSDVQLNTAAVNGAVLATTGYTMLWAGEIVTISYDLSAAATVGYLTLGPTIGGTEKTDPTLTVTTGVSGSDTCNRGKSPFAQGAIIFCEVTSSGEWNATPDLVVTVWVILSIAGI